MSEACGLSMCSRAVESDPHVCNQGECSVRFRNVRECIGTGTKSSLNIDNSYDI